MQRVCPKCNTLVTGEGSFCPSCGEPLPAAVELKKEPAEASVQYTAPQTGTNGAYQYTQSNSAPNYGAPQPNTIPNYGSTPNNSQFTNANVVNTTEMTLGSWVGTIIVTTWFGLISLIFCIVWGVSDTVPTAKKRYCQAMLIIQAINLVLSIIAMIIFFTSLASAVPQIVAAIEDTMGSGSYNGYYYY